MIGWVDGRPVPRGLLDRRVAELRGGPLRAALPVPGSSEDRQLARWLTQVILTEVLCEGEAARLGLAPVEGPALDRLAAVELGSVNAAAYNASPWVKALFRHVPVEIPSAWRSRAAAPAEEVALVRHRLYARRPATWSEADLESLGEIAPATLPAAIAGALAEQPYGTLVGPVQDALGWHVAIAVPGSGGVPDGGHVAVAVPGSGGVPDEGLEEAGRRRAFARWLDRLRADRVELVPGLEHPGDPRQPDNHHKH
ncbi:hypothetical protein ACIBEJ_16695 [Nonomuraea sp. NPDC050790]|uniref:DUF7158 domain-containing protein n=1 Tax=Nonomuraea sp. NPDC050790 TaxID=3364371 RepID=UPI0037BAA724